jgi:Flp pilus assembly pilin Flp
MHRNNRRRSNFLLRLIHDERGGEVLEYAIVAGLIAIAAISMITTVGEKVLARWASINSKM